MTDLNLLQFPTLQRQQARQRQWRWGLWSGCCGAALTAVITAAVAWQTDTWQRQAQAIEQRLAQRKTAMKNQQQREQHNQQLQQELTQLSRLQSHQQAWVSLQNDLQEVLAQQGVQVQRLQIDNGRIDLQGWAPDAAAMGRASHTLSLRWGQTLNLQSLEAEAAGRSGLAFAWGAQWPALTDGLQSQSKAKP